MRVLESAFHRYDLGIRLLSLGHIGRVYDRVVQFARGPEVLDLGCGSGNVALRLARRGLRVTGVDLSPDMLNLARQKTPPEATVRWVQTGAVELIDHFPADSFDTITSILLFSELSEAEQREALRQCHCLLRANGQLIIADEVRAPTRPCRAVHNLLRLPLAAITYALTQTSTNPVRDLETKVTESPFAIVGRESNRLGDFMLLQAEKQEVKDAAAA